MEIQNNKSATSSKQKEELRIIDQNFGVKFKPDMSFLEKLFFASPYWLPKDIIYRMWDALSGYSLEMQVLIVHNLSDFMRGCGRQLTGINHVDEQLLPLYKDIYEYAQANGRSLGCPFQSTKDCAGCQLNAVLNSHNYKYIINYHGTKDY